MPPHEVAPSQPRAVPGPGPLTRRSQDGHTVLHGAWGHFIPTSSAGGLLFSKASPAFRCSDEVSLDFLDDGRSDRREVQPPCSSDLRFTDNQ